MRSEAFAGESCGECGVGDLGVVVGLFGEDCIEDIGDFLVGIDDEDSGGACGDAVHRDMVGFHEAVELGDGDPSVFGAWDSVSLELTGIEPFGDGSWGNIADFGDLTCCEDIFFDRHSSHLDTSQKWTGTIRLRRVRGSIGRTGGWLYIGCAELGSICLSRRVGSSWCAFGGVIE